MIESYNENNKDLSYYENFNGYGLKNREEEVYKGYGNNVERQRMSDKSYYENFNGYDLEKREKEVYMGYRNNVER